LTPIRHLRNLIAIKASSPGPSDSEKGILMTLIVLTVIGVLAIALVTSVAVIVHDLATEPPQRARHLEPTLARR
jgi:hypothetical protein